MLYICRLIISLVDVNSLSHLLCSLFPHFDIIKIIILGLKFGLMSTNYCLSTASGQWKPQVGKAGEGSKNSNYHLFLKEYIWVLIPRGTIQTVDTHINFEYIQLLFDLIGPMNITLFDLHHQSWIFRFRCAYHHFFLEFSCGTPVGVSVGVWLECLFDRLFVATKYAMVLHQTPASDWPQARCIDCPNCHVFEVSLEKCSSCLGLEFPH